MTQRRDRLSVLMTRRRMLNAGLAAVSGLLLSDRRGGSKTVAAASEDFCYWETRQTQCVDGRLMAYRCEICCAGGSCETVQCAWFDSGPC